MVAFPVVFQAKAIKVSSDDCSRVSIADELPGTLSMSALGCCRHSTQPRAGNPSTLADLLERCSRYQSAYIYGIPGPERGRTGDAIIPGNDEGIGTTRLLRNSGEHKLLGFRKDSVQHVIACHVFISSS